MIKKLIAVLLLMLLGISLHSCKEYVIYTDNIAHYEEYGVNEWDIFPNKIPTNAQVIKFSYYSYYEEDTDAYLELKFETLSELESYLNEFKSALLKNYPSKKPLYNNDCWFEIDCPYDENFEESIYLGHAGHRAADNSHHVGYSTGDFTANFYFNVLLYSRESLCVIHSSTSGTFNRANKHTPTYFKRFGIALDENIERMYIFTEKNSELFLNNE